MSGPGGPRSGKIMSRTKRDVLYSRGHEKGGPRKGRLFSDVLSRLGARRERDLGVGQELRQRRNAVARITGLAPGQGVAGDRVGLRAAEETPVLGAQCPAVGQVVADGRSSHLAADDGLYPAVPGLADDWRRPFSRTACCPGARWGWWGPDA